jgi:flagellar protein FlbD
VPVIKVSRLQGKEFFINPDMIEFIEETPDLVVSLISGKKVVVAGSAEELVDKVIEYRIRTHVPLPDIVRRNYDGEEESSALQGR